MGLVFDKDGAYIRKALRDTSDLVNVPQTICVFDGHLDAGAIAIPQRYTSDRSSLGKMLGIAHKLYQMNPSDMMKVRHDTIVSYDADMSQKKLDKIGIGLRNALDHSGSDAFYRNWDERIYCNPEFLQNPTLNIDEDEALAVNMPDWDLAIVEGDLALIILTCHECSHYSTINEDKDHGKKWRMQFAKFFFQIIHDIKSRC